MNTTKQPMRQSIYCMFITRPHGLKHTYDIAWIDNTFKFNVVSFHYSIQTISYEFNSKIKKIFNNFIFSATTDINITQNISKNDPLVMYLKILQTHMYCKVRFVEINQIPRRIATYHNTYLDKDSAAKVTIHEVNALWDKLLKYEKCPWITQEINNKLNNSSNTNIKRMKFLRLGVYYMLIKQHLYNKFKNSVGYKKKQLEKIQ